MKQVALIFLTTAELDDFENLVETKDYTTINNGLSIIGTFTDREIELAINAYHAKVIEINSNEKVV
ncbi:MAG: hypothetical protein ACTHOF_12755 [Flavisolibacter sp.]